MHRSPRRPFYVLAATAAVAALVMGSCGGGSDGERATELVNEGLALHAEQRADDAARVYREALVLDANNKFALFNLAVIDQERGEIVRAELRYRLALTTDPNFKPALFNLAILVAQRDEEEAVDIYEQLIEIDPQNAAAHLNLGFLLIDLGKDSDGKAALDRAVELDPTLEERISAREADQPGAEEQP